MGRGRGRLFFTIARISHFLFQWHPDKNPGDEQATKNFQKISEAYATLTDEKKRKIYDQYGKEAANQSDHMDDMPGGGMPFGFRPGGGGHHHGGMSQEDAARIFAQFFGGGDPFGGGFGGMGGMGGMPVWVHINMPRPGAMRG